jgi:hypothetical protein
MDILQEHFIRKKTRSRLFFMVDTSEDIEKSQDSSFKLDQKYSNIKSSNNNIFTNNRTFKSKDMEDIKEIIINEER